LTAEEKKRELAQYRIKQAEESHEEAQYLLSGKKSPRSVINRTYYAMFYAVLALLIHEPYSSSKHSGVLSYFNRRFIKSGLLDTNLGRSINGAFELRQCGDYREHMQEKGVRFVSVLTLRLCVRHSKGIFAGQDTQAKAEAFYHEGHEGHEGKPSRRGSPFYSTTRLRPFFMLFMYFMVRGS